MNKVGSRFLDLCSPLTFHVLEQQLNIRDPRVRANLASALVRLNPDRRNSADPGQQILRQLFGLGE